MRLVQIAASVGHTAEHIIAERDIFRMLQVQSDCLDDGGVDRDVAVLFPLSCVPRLLLKNGKALLKSKIVVDEVGEPQHPQVADPQTEVDANNKKHIVPIPLVRDQIPGDFQNIIHAFDGLRRVFRRKLADSAFGCGSNQAILQLAVVPCQLGYIDRPASCGR